MVQTSVHGVFMSSCIVCLLHDTTSLCLLWRQRADIRLFCTQLGNYKPRPGPRMVFIPQPWFAEPCTMVLRKGRPGYSYSYMVSKPYTM